MNRTQRIARELLALVIGTCIALAPVAGCVAPPMTPEQQVERDALVLERDAALDARDEAVLEAEAAATRTEELAAQLAQLEEGSDAYAAKLAEVVAALDEFNAWKATAEESAGDAQEQEERIVQLEAKAARGVGELVIDSVSPLVPGSAAAKPWLLSLVPLLFKRPRQHFANALRDLNPFDGQVAPVRALEDLARAYGLKHSSEDPEVLLRVAEKKAAAKGMRLVGDGKGGARVERLTEETKEAA